MARESCNLDKDEAEILTPPSSSTPAAPASLFLKPTPPVMEFTAQRPERSEPVGAAKRKSVGDEGCEPAVRCISRCSSCRKRVGLTGFRCRCGDLFCPRHRYSDAHDCSFDYKAAGREEIMKNNPVVRAAKIIKI